MYLSNTYTQSTLQLHIIYLYIQNCPLLYTCKCNCQFVYCYSLFTSFLFFFLLFVFFVTVIMLHCSSFCHVNKFIVCVNIPGNKAHSDSDSENRKSKVAGDARTRSSSLVFFLFFFFYSKNNNTLSRNKIKRKGKKL